VDLADGEENRPGAVYEVKKDAAEPFNTLPGKEFELISVTPVLNAPFVVNTDNITDDDQQKIIDTLTSDKISENEKVFVPADSKFSGLFSKKSGNERLLAVEDKFFDPIRELSK
jgi:phosphonate transport system substrate-binding protein